MDTDETPFSVTAPAVLAVNALGLDLHRKLAIGDVNLCLSPYSIQSALAMTYAGADGKTRAEMAAVLHFPMDDAVLHQSFTEIRRSLDDMAIASARRIENLKRWGGQGEPVTLNVANRLFGPAGHEFRAPFLALMQASYAAPLETINFKSDATGATRRINGWVEDQTAKRICDLIPRAGLDALTRLVLVNAVYLKAPWDMEFPVRATMPSPFHIRGSVETNVPTMRQQGIFGYLKGNGFTAVSIPYSGGELHFVALLPDDAKGLSALETQLTAATLSRCANLNQRKIIIHLPKFKLEPPVVELRDALEALGMKSAFDQPTGSANFDRMAARKPNDYLAISQIFHKTFFALDEKGTEAAAATAVEMRTVLAMVHDPPKPIEVKVDRPFVFAIQHRPSGACLFLGRVTDPR